MPQYFYSNFKQFCKLNYFYIVFLFTPTHIFGQLGFCSGSSGAPVFLENFGSGTNYGPALPSGITSYTYVSSGFPDDGQYTLYYRTNLIPGSANWHYSLDHTPDTETDGYNGKCLIVNAGFTPSYFYKRTVTGLCSNTKFEFSAWLMNIYNSASNGCSGTGIPINVTFEIWNASDTVMLHSGNTGNIVGISSPIWNQYAMVFTLGAGETSVILKMRNNGIGGCGNDLAIDDITFKSCGDNSSIVNNEISGTTQTYCDNETIIYPNLEVVTTGTNTHVYQWQQSTDNVNFTDISGATGTTFTLPTSLSTTTYYRTKVAEDIVNLNNLYCSTLSDIYTVVINPLPNAPVSNGDLSLCSNQTSTLSVTVNTNESVNWYSASSGGTLLQASSLSYTPTVAGTYYAEAYNFSSGCKSETRTPVTLLPITTVTPSGNLSICTGETTAINLSSSNSNATINWTATSSDVTGFSNGSGNSISQTLTYTGTTSGSVTYTITPVEGSCEGATETIIVTVYPLANITPIFPTIATTYCTNGTPDTLPTTTLNSPSVTGTWSPSIIDTSTTGTTTYTFTGNASTCTTIQPFQLTVVVADSFMPDFEDNLSFCFGDAVPILSSTSPNGITGSWNPATIDNTASGSYIFTPDSGQCASSHTLTVSILEATLSSIELAISEAFAENQTVTVMATSAGNYQYQLDDNTPQESTIFENLSSGEHSITVYDLDGCSDELTENFYIIDYPKFFSPNGDGYNDFWTISGLETLGKCTVSIFDRYGKLLKQIGSGSTGWDGTFNGYKLPASDYWFTIEFNELSRPQFRSHFSLIR